MVKKNHNSIGIFFYPCRAKKANVEHSIMTERLKHVITLKTIVIKISQIASAS